VTNDLNRPTFATSIGLIEYALAQGAISAPAKSINFGSLFSGINFGNLGNLSSKVRDIFKSIIP
jgi:hypothetical protein